MPDKKRLDKLLDNFLFEQPEGPEEQEPKNKLDPKEKSTAEKESDVEKKDIEDVEKKDLEDGEDKEEEDTDDKDVVVSVKLNDNVDSGGQIKLVGKKKLSGLSSIENVLSLFHIDPEKAPKGFKDKMEITINSPLSDFKEHEYTITLMDKIGQLSIARPDFKTTITKKSKGNLEQAVQAGVGEQPPEQEEPEEQVDISYLPELDTEFLKAVKNEFFDRILERR